MTEFVEKPDATICGYLLFSIRATTSEHESRQISYLELHDNFRYILRTETFSEIKRKHQKKKRPTKQLLKSEYSNDIEN